MATGKGLAALIRERFARPVLYFALGVTLVANTFNIGACRFDGRGNRPCRHAVGDRWFVDETYVKVAGRWHYVHRVVDQHGQIIDVFVSARRDMQAARRFFAAALASSGEPQEVVTDRAWTLRTVIDELIPAAVHSTEHYANDLIGNRTKNRHPRSRSRQRKGALRVDM